MESLFAEHAIPNGLRIVCETMPRAGSAATGFLVRTGSRHERTPELYGVSHFLEHMCFKGTERRTWRDINVRFDELGSIYNAFTSKEHTVYYGWTPAPRLIEQFELLADMMHPSLPPEEFETERQVILEEIAMSGDSFEHHLFNFLHEVAFADTPLAHEILGQPQSIRHLPREAMLAYHRERYAPGRVCLVACGALEPETLFAAAGRVCSDWQPADHAPEPQPPPRALPRGSTTHKLRLERFQQQAVMLVFPSQPHGCPERESIEAFTALFGGPNSRCYWNIVQKGICTHAGAAWVAYADCGLMALYAVGQPQRCEEMLAALRREARRAQRKGFRADEVQRVRNRRRTQLALEAENPQTRLMQLIDDLEVYGCPRTVDWRLAAVERVTPQTIADYLHRFPIDDGGLLLSVGPRDWP